MFTYLDLDIKQCPFSQSDFVNILWKVNSKLCDASNCICWFQEENNSALVYSICCHKARSFIYSFVRSFVHSFVDSIVHSFFRSFRRSFLYLFIYFVSQSFSQSADRPVNQLIIYLSNQQTSQVATLLVILPSNQSLSHPIRQPFTHTAIQTASHSAIRSFDFRNRL